MGRTLPRNTLTGASDAGLLGDAGDVIDSFMVAGAAAPGARDACLDCPGHTPGARRGRGRGLWPPTLRRLDYHRTGRKPTIVWADADTRQALLQDWVADSETLGHWITDLEDPVESLQQPGQLLATVATQDVARTDDGTGQIAHQVASDRVLSTVDPEMGHGRKSSSHKFDGYRAHVTVQQPADHKPRFITGIIVTPGTMPDGIRRWLRWKNDAN